MCVLAPRQSPHCCLLQPSLLLCSAYTRPGLSAEHIQKKRLLDQEAMLL